MQKERIQLVDSFRFLALIGVVVYHYTLRWTIPYSPANYYPYGHFYGYAFKYGYLGVHLFFMISGFVISYTLENTSGFLTFARNRFTRLFPAMACWTLLTYVLFIVADNKDIFPWTHDAANLLPSLSFTNPGLWTEVFGRQFYWINGSYWSLWVEVQLYFVAAIVYYKNKERFLTHMLVVSLILALISYIPQHFMNRGNGDHLSPRMFSLFHQFYILTSLFNAGRFIGFFSMGVVFFQLYKGYTIRWKSWTGACIILVFSYQLYDGIMLYVRLAYILMIVLFLLMIYRRRYLFFLDNRLFRRVGVISYSAYLAHEQIGVLLINKYGGYLGKWSPLSVPLVILLILLLSELSYRFVEQKLGRTLKLWLSGFQPAFGQ